MVLPDSDRVSRVPSYSGYFSAITTFGYGTFTPFGQASQLVLLIALVLNEVLQPQHVNILVCPMVRSLAATSTISIDFSS